MRDVAERAAVHERRARLAGLDEVRHQRVPEQRRHRAACAERSPARTTFPSGPRATTIRAQRASRSFRSLESPRIAITLAGRGDVEAGLARDALRLAAQSDDDLAQRAVVHVERARPGHVRPSIGTGAPEVQRVVPSAARRLWALVTAWMSPVSED